MPLFPGLLTLLSCFFSRFTNHFPDKMYKELHRLAEALKVPPVETVFAQHRPQAPAPEPAPSRSKSPGDAAGQGGAGQGGSRSRTPDRTSPRSRTPPSEKGANTSPRRVNTSPRRLAGGGT